MIADMNDEVFDVALMRGVSAERTDRFMTLTSLTQTHDVDPDDQKSRIILPLESAIRRTLQCIVAQRAAPSAAQRATSDA